MFKCAQTTQPSFSTESFSISIEQEALVGEIVDASNRAVSDFDSIDVASSHAETLGGTIEILESKTEFSPEEIALTQSALDLMGAGAGAQAEDFGFAAEGNNFVPAAMTRALDRLKAFLEQLLKNIREMLARMVENFKALCSRIFTGIEYRRMHLAALKKRLDLVKTVASSSNVVRVQTGLGNYISAGRVTKTLGALNTEIATTSTTILTFAATYHKEKASVIGDVTTILEATSLDTIEVDAIKIAKLGEGFQGSMKLILGGGRHNSTLKSSLFCSRYLLGQKAIVMKAMEIAGQDHDIRDTAAIRFALMSSQEIESKHLEVEAFDMPIGTHAEIKHLVDLIDSLLTDFVEKVKAEQDDFLKKFQTKINQCTKHIDSYIKTLKAGEQNDINSMNCARFSSAAQLPATMLDWVANPMTAISSHVLVLSQTYAALADKMVSDYESRMIKPKA